LTSTIVEVGDCSTGTSLGLVEGTGIRPGEWALVTAAGGGLGILLVQLAHAAGARVAAAARGKRKLDLALELGADAAVDYSEPGWAERVREVTGGAGPNEVTRGRLRAFEQRCNPFEIVVARGYLHVHEKVGVLDQAKLEDLQRNPPDRRPGVRRRPGAPPSGSPTSAGRSRARCPRRKAASAARRAGRSGSRSSDNPICPRPEATK
jgi:threonine dehydrogenase-like Zn-dependent dehydrogenase